MTIAPTFIMPEVVLQKIIQLGIRDLRKDEAAFRRIFDSLTQQDLDGEYGDEYINNLWEWFTETKIPTIQAWAWNTQRVPSYSIHLRMEQEDERNAAIGDHWGADAIGNDVGANTFRVTLDIGIHGHKQFDQVLWLYYILTYVLFKQKRLAESLGLQLQTFGASDYSPDSKYMADNVFTRWIKFNCLVVNTWQDVEAECHDIIVDVDADRANE